MQVPADAHDFCLRTQVMPLLSEIMSHPAVTFSPLIHGLIGSLIKAEEMPMAVRRKRLVNEREHFSISTAISERVPNELWHGGGLPPCPSFQRIPFILWNFHA